MPEMSNIDHRVMLVVWQLGWVEINLGNYTTCWAAGVMAEWAEQLGRLVELENLSQHNQLPDHQHHPVDRGETITKHKQDLDAPFGAIKFFNNRHAKNMAQSCTMYGATFYF